MPRDCTRKQKQDGNKTTVSCPLRFPGQTPYFNTRRLNNPVAGTGSIVLSLPVFASPHQPFAPVESYFVTFSPPATSSATFSEGVPPPLPLPPNTHTRTTTTTTTKKTHAVLSNVQSWSNVQPPP